MGGNHNLVLTARPVIVSISPPAQAEIGSSVTLTVSAFGEPLSYQWQRFGTNLPGKTNAALVMNAIEVADAGPYKVIVTNPHGTNAGSTAISLPPPTITTQPQNSTVYRGEIARFNVTANGLAPLAYQWFKDTNAIAGATNSVLEIATMDRNDSGPYHAVVRDAAGGSVTSAVANLIVIDPRENTLVFRPVLDTSIHSSGTNPLGTTILAGTRRNGIVDRGLLRFDLTSIGTNVAVQSAFLRLSVVKSPSLAADSTFQLHRVLVPWTAEATWTSASPQVPWSAAGGVAGVDYSVPGIPGEFLFGSGDYVFDSSDQMLGDINLWIQSPATNHGWMLISDSENVGGTARHFSSSESANPPELVIRSFIPAPPPTITNASVQSTNFVFQFQGSPGWIYSIQTSADVNGEVWAPFTNAPAGAALTPIVISVPITNRHQFFRAFRY